MRFEGKHAFFKDMRIKNFINLPFPLAEKYQLYLTCKIYDMYEKPNTNFVYDGDLTAEVTVVRQKYSNLSPECMNVYPNKGTEMYEMYECIL